MTDREKAGLRGPVKICVHENIYPTGTVSIKSEYAIDGKLFLSRTSHQDGSEWVITHTRQVGANHPREGARTDFRYDAEGRKTAIQTFEPETLLGLQNTAFVGSAWDAIGVPVGGKVTTTYNRPASSGGDTRR